MRNVTNYISTVYLAPTTAVKKAKRIKETIQNKLSFMPQKYRFVDDRKFASRGMRKMNVENYIAFFVINEKLNTVKVIRIIHSKRDWKRLLPEEKQ